MKRTDAEAIAESLEGAIACLTKSLHRAGQSLPPAEFEEFQRAIGLTIGRLAHELLDPIYAEHPDLAPPGVL